MNREIIIAVIAGSIILYIIWKRRSRAPVALPSTNQTHDVVVAKVGDLKDGEMKVVKVHESSVLLVKDNGSFSALGNQCTHSGAPLNTGTYLNGVVRCPWHGACFNTTTGDIEDFPGLLNVPTFKVRVNGDDVVVSASPEEVAVKKVAAKLCKKGSDPRTFVIVGAGAAGGTAAFQLREEGFEGRVILIGSEKHLPYDRTKLSKTMTATADKLALRSPSAYDEHDIELKLGVQVTKLNADKKTIHLSSGEDITYDSCLVATGANPMRLEKWIVGNDVHRDNVFVLRNADEGPAIVAACEKKRVAIVGSSFIGVETAAAVVANAESVVVIGMEKVPFERVLGEQVGSVLQKLHESKGIKFRMNAVCQEFKVEHNKVHTIVLKDGSSIACDVVVIGAGVIPSTGFVEGASVKKHVDQSIIADAHLATGAPGLYVAGDLARFPLPCLNNELVRIEHWGIAQTMGKIAAKNMVHKVQVPMKSVPVFWTVAYGKSVRYAGHGIGVDETVVDSFGVDIDPVNPKFIAYYARKGKIIAISSCQADPVVSDFASLLANGITLNLDDLLVHIKQGKSGQFIRDMVQPACAKLCSK